MFQSSLISLIILLACGEIFCANLRNIKCDKNTETQMDSDAAKLIVFGQQNVKFPVNAQQLRVYCNEAKKLVDHLTAYSNKCMPKFGKEVFRILMYSINKEIKAVCRSGRLSKKAQELLNAAKCTNAGLGYYQKCNDNWIDAYQGLQNADEKLRIPMACCHYHKMVECLITESEDVKECNKATVDYIEKYINNILRGVLQFMCYEYTEDNEKCDYLVRITPKINSTIPRFKSILPPTINIVANVKDV